jgi:hypothetical protein
MVTINIQPKSFPFLCLTFSNRKWMLCFRQSLSLTHRRANQTALPRTSASSRFLIVNRSQVEFRVTPFPASQTPFLIVIFSPISPCSLTPHHSSKSLLARRQNPSYLLSFHQKSHLKSLHFHPFFARSVLLRLCSRHSSGAPGRPGFGRPGWSSRATSHSASQQAKIVFYSKSETTKTKDVL